MSVSKKAARSLKKKSCCSYVRLFLGKEVSRAAKTSERESWDVKGPFWNYLEVKMLGANRWHFYLIASRCIARLGLTKGWAWDKVMGNCPKRFEEAFGAGVTWHFLFKRSFDQNSIWIRLQGWCLKKFGIALLNFDSNQLQVWTSTHQELLHRQTLLSFMLNLQCCTAATFISLSFILSLKLGTSFWLIDKASTLSFKPLLKTNLHFAFTKVKQQQVGEIGRKREYSIYISGPITKLLAHTPEK